MKRIVFFITLLLAVGFAYAGPADPNIIKKITLPDGETKTVRLLGDENFHYWEDANDSVCYYFNAQAKKIVSTSRAKMRLMVQARQHNELKRLKSYDAQTLSGERNVLVILVDFSDQHFTEDAVSHYNGVFNTDNFPLGEDVVVYNKYYQQVNYGSVRNYFLDQSNNKLNLHFDVVGPVRLPENHNYYSPVTNPTTGGLTYPKFGELLSYACNAVDSEVDFSKYDWDEDGKVEQIVIVFAGLAQELGGDASNIWSHHGAISPTISLDGKSIETYSCVSDKRTVYYAWDEKNKAWKTKNAYNGIGTICHEFSHGLGLPDFYGVNTSSKHDYGTSYWDVMGYGVHNNLGYTPAGYTTQDKMMLGWSSPIELKNNTRVSDIKALSDGGNGYIIKNEGHEDEYYLLEYRRQTGWDRNLKGHGLLVMHVDFDSVLFKNIAPNQTSSQNSHERCAIVPADNNFAESNDGYAGDTYPFNSNNSLNDNSTPSFSLYYPNLDGSFEMKKSLSNIVEYNGLMSFNFTNHMPYDTEYLLRFDSAYCHRILGDSIMYTIRVHNISNIDYNAPISFTLLLKDGSKYNKVQTKQLDKVKIPSNSSLEVQMLFDDVAADTLYRIQVGSYKVNGDYVPQCSTDFNSSYDYNLVAARVGSVEATSWHSIKVKATITNNSINDYNKEDGIRLSIYKNTDGNRSWLSDVEIDLKGLSALSTKNYVFEAKDLVFEKNQTYRVYAYYYKNVKSSERKQMPYFAYDFTTDVNSIPIKQIPMAFLTTEPDNSKTLTFAYAADSTSISKNGADGAYMLTPDDKIPGWQSVNKSVTKVIFDKSFDNFIPKRTNRWFYGMSSLMSIDGLNYLRTDSLKSLKYFFYNCASLKKIDLSSFKTDKVTDMSYMFFGCSNLDTIDISNFNTNNVTTTDYMFYRCSNLSLFCVGNNDFKQIEENNSFYGIGQPTKPCVLKINEQFDKLVLGLPNWNDTIACYRWRSGYFKPSTTGLVPQSIRWIQKKDSMIVGTIYTFEAESSTSNPLKYEVTGDINAVKTTIKGNKLYIEALNEGNVTITVKAFGDAIYAATKASTILTIFKEIPSGINEVVYNKNNVDTKEWYKLNGVRLQRKPTSQGIYIHGGKKVVIPK